MSALSVKHVNVRVLLERCPAHDNDCCEVAISGEWIVEDLYLPGERSLLRAFYVLTQPDDYSVIYHVYADDLGPHLKIDLEANDHPLRDGDHPVGDHPAA